MQKIYIYFTLLMCLFFCLPVNVFATSPEELPSLPASEFENSGYVVFSLDSINGGGTYLYYYNKDVVTDKPFISVIPGSGGFQANLRFFRSVSVDAGSNWLNCYILITDEDGSTRWALSSSVSADSNSTQYFNAVIDGDGRYPDSITTQFYYSSDGIYFNDVYGLGGGSRDFFPLTRFPITLTEAVETGLQNLMKTVQSSALLLTSLGVGLMALLISVILLSTKFRQFLR